MKKGLLICIVTLLTVPYGIAQTNKLDSLAHIADSIFQQIASYDNQKDCLDIDTTKIPWRSVQHSFFIINDTIHLISNFEHVNPPLELRYTKNKTYVLPLTEISKVLLETRTFEGTTKSYSGLRFVAKNGRSSFGKVSKSKVYGRSAINIGSSVKENYERFVELQRLIQEIIEIGNKGKGANTETRDTPVPILFKNHIVFEIDKLDQLPQFAQEKDLYDFQQTIYQYLEKNIENYHKDRLFLCCIILNTEGVVEQVYFDDECYTETDEQLQQNLSPEDYELYSQIQAMIGKNSFLKELKANIRSALFAMPKWEPGKINGQNVPVIISML